MKLIKTITLITYSFLLIQSCAGQKELHNNYYQQLHAYLFQKKENNKLYIGLGSFEQMNGGGSINFHHQDYGYYQTFSPIVEQAQGIIFEAFMNAQGEQLLRIKDKKHLVFYFGEKKEEFLLIRKNDRIEIKKLKGGHYIQFEKDHLNLLPDRILQIKVPSNKSLSSDLAKNINSLGNPILKLPLGYYSRFNLDEYAQNNAHLSAVGSNKVERIFFFKMNKNYAKTKSLVEEFAKNNYKAFDRQLKYSFNFNVKEMIEAEKNGGKLIVKVPSHLKNSIRSRHGRDTKELEELKKILDEETKSANRGREISFALKKPSSVSLKIFDLLGNEIKEIKLNVDAPGTITYVWDGQINENKKVKRGAYFYHLYVDGKMQSTKRFIIP